MSKKIEDSITFPVEELQDWPVSGEIEYKNVFARYRSELPQVLRNLNMKIRPKEKIGVVGRTGAGKSTIILSLLRILEIESGSIEIDGVDISKINLNELRKKITVILQDPQLFEGKLRDNVDPLVSFSDQEIIQTLTNCGLEDLIKNRGSLEMMLDEGGENLSVGEK